MTVCRGRYCFDSTDVLAVFTTVGPRTICTMRREMGPQLDPNVIGRAGEIGPIQLHSRGLLPLYLRDGLDPWNPYHAAPWLQQKLIEGMGRHWSPILVGLC